MRFDEFSFDSFLIRGWLLIFRFVSIRLVFISHGRRTLDVASHALACSYAPQRGAGQVPEKENLSKPLKNYQKSRKITNSPP